mmetsp:Transcript_26105/g.36804  ORF Transcript_26105/g.36804 Transcript_26105/m.36804 type:complete len:460 (+) Transcript_26105:164-1543(+)
MAVETSKLLEKSSRFRDDYIYVDLYHEADHMLSASGLIYTLAALRDLAWKNQKLLKEGKPIPADLTDETFLTPEVDPKTGLFAKSIPIPELAQFSYDNIENMKKDTEFWGTHGATIELMKKLAPSYQKTKDRSTRMSTMSVQTRSIVYVDDSVGDESEIVFAVSVDDIKNRIIVNFRGTTTGSDVLQDVKITLKTYKLPNVDKEVKLHRGFHDYLFDEEMRKEDEGEHGDKNKYEEIMHKVKPLLQKHPDYKLYVTGHSLGASLSSLFAFVASQETDPVVPKPVTCVSVASPYVGNQAWREVFQAAEEAGQIRYLRISNRTDLVPHGPPFDLFGNLYKHVGVNLCLSQERWYWNKKPTYSFHYPTGSVLTEWGCAISNNFITNCAWVPSGILKMHGCSEYDRRLDSLKEDLVGIELNDLYEDYFATKKKVEANWLFHMILKYTIPLAMIAAAVFLYKEL